MAGKKEKAPIIAGFGESKVFAAEMPFDPRCPKGVNIEECHYRGKLISELREEGMDVDLFWSKTDEGIEWYESMRADLGKYGNNGEAGRGGRGMKLPDGTEATDEEDKKLLQYRDNLMKHNPSADDFDGLRLQQDPFAETMREHTPIGHRGLFMSERQCREKGMVRGPLKYEKVLVKNKETGAMEPVVVGGMFLASVPEELAQKSERFHAAINREKQVTAQERVRQQADQIMSESGLRDLAKKKRVLDDLAGLETENADAADYDLVHSSE